uniref:BTB domain-containing protein n=1 Tax=Timema monikensis TaxID=170555 RepID=A0A7R9E751_9NEOP|nr:unnamed protein product [Timema monikensis]
MSNSGDASDEVTTVLRTLKSTSSSKLYKVLVKLRSLLGGSRDALCVVESLLQDSEALKEVLKCLEQTNEKLIDVALSLLGQCCYMKEDIRLKVCEYGVIPSLVVILRNMTRDCVLCRASRLVGNLAQTPSVAQQLHSAEIVAPLVTILGTKNTSNSTILMTIRALRLLWSVAKRRADMLKCNTVRLVVTLLEREQTSSFIKGIMKAVAVFTSECTEQCAKQVYGEGSGFTQLVRIASIDYVKSEALQSLVNLCHVPLFRPFLGQAGVVALIVAEINQRPDSSMQDDSICKWCKGQEETINQGSECECSHVDPWHQSLLEALYQLCRESVNRARVREEGGLALLLCALRRSLHGGVLAALVHFLYDEPSLELMVQDGLVGVLATHLKTSRKRQFTGQSPPNKRFRASSPSYQQVVREQESRGVADGDTLVGSNECGLVTPWEGSSSPTMGTSPGGWSPTDGSWSPGEQASAGRSPSSPCSPPSSPCSSLLDYPEVYSPVEMTDDSDAYGDPILTRICTKSSSSQDGKMEEDVKLGILVMLLTRVTYLEGPVEDLISHSTLTTLLDYYSNKVANPHPNILVRIVRNFKYFMPLVTQQFVLAVNSRLNQPCQHEGDKCQKSCTMARILLKNLELQAESGFGEGQLAHTLLRGGQANQQVVAVSVPFIVKRRWLLRKLLLGCDGLAVVSSALRNPPVQGDLVTGQVAECVSRLATSLGVANPKQNKFWTKLGYKDDNPAIGNVELLVSGEDEDIVLLKLDDGGEVPAKRSMLINFSPVFEAMFKGGFKESTQTMVTLSGTELQPAIISMAKDVDISTPCLKLLLHLAARQPISSLPEMDLLLSLELIQALDQFLVPGGWSLARRITTLLLDPYSAGSLYRQCVGHIVAPLVALKQAALHYALVATMTTNQRSILFDELRACPGALGEVRELLRGQLLPCKYVHIMTATAGSAAHSSTGINVSHCFVPLNIEAIRLRAAKQFLVSSMQAPHSTPGLLALHSRHSSMFSLSTFSPHGTDVTRPRPPPSLLPGPLHSPYSLIRLMSSPLYSAPKITPLLARVMGTVYQVCTLQWEAPVSPILQGQAASNFVLTTSPSVVILYLPPRLALPGLHPTSHCDSRCRDSFLLPLHPSLSDCPCHRRFHGMVYTRHSGKAHQQKTLKKMSPAKQYSTRGPISYYPNSNTQTPGRPHSAPTSPSVPTPELSSSSHLLLSPTT